MLAGRRSKKWVMVLGLVFVIVAAVFGVFLMIKNINEKETMEAEEGVEEIMLGELFNVEKKDDDMGETIEKKPIVQYAGEDANDYTELTGVISYASVINGEMIVRVNIDQYLTSGVCQMRILSDNEVLQNKRASIISSVSTATCDGFRVSGEELGTGTLKIEVDLEADGKYGKIEGELNI